MLVNTKTSLNLDAIQTSLPSQPLSETSRFFSNFDRTTFQCRSIFWSKCGIGVVGAHWKIGAVLHWFLRGGIYTRLLIKATSIWEKPRLYGKIWLSRTCDDLSDTLGIFAAKMHTEIQCVFILLFSRTVGLIAHVWENKAFVSIVCDKTNPT